MSSRIPKEFIQDLIARCDIVEIIRSRITLTKRGRNYLACCPFHSEKSPSFTVSPEKQFYYCFGCGAHGNVVGFLMNYDRMEFREAMESLAADQGLELPQENQSTPQVDYEIFYQWMEKATLFYQENLKKSQAAINYFKKRGVSGRLAKEFRLGYAAAEWDLLAQHFGTDLKLRSQLTTLGLLIEKNPGKHYDRFRHRIIFPIRDVRGRVIAFGGRTITDEQPKYLNSPETPLFHKSNELYGLYEAKQKQRELKQALVVEGYMDVIGLAQHGITYAVATLGTAVNPKHLQKILRYTNKVVFCFDGDNAGRQAAWKALTMSLPILREGIHLQFLFLPNGEDPDSLVVKIGKDAFEKLVAEAKPLAEVFFAHVKEQIPTHTLEGKAHFAKEVSRYLDSMSSGIYQKLLYQQLAEMVQMNPKDLNATMAETEKTVPLIKPKPSQKSAGLSPAELACALLLKQPSLAQSAIDMTSFQELKLTGVALLLRLLNFFEKNPSFSIGQLLSEWTPAEEHPEIVRLAAHPTFVNPEGIKEEFLGTIKKLHQMQLQQIADYLIHKSKNTGLTEAERQQLQAILTYKSNIINN